ncbi:hypothetical protein FC75_GL002230 [Lacticaseibacillus camelliae DSM 22697 = JCM 13995]|uniref:Uncharacterized protein n=1 Tax=Lacticaseibacillus camelliae DSM 22697 = JCM 13995 TaxID=1423730 RepID=A0A0R2F9F2_9LACO|nr:hypothetical protein FC75_GL002230 [Lacticaseibacillus camelliae DSM 22697 = JCM 13995]
MMELVYCVQLILNTQYRSKDKGRWINGAALSPKTPDSSRPRMGYPLLLRKNGVIHREITPFL